MQIAVYMSSSSSSSAPPPFPSPSPPPLSEPNGILIFIVFVADVSGGFSPSILDAIRSALGVSIHISFGKCEDYVPLTFHEAFYLATLGGATGIVNLQLAHLNLHKQ